MDVLRHTLTSEGIDKNMVAASNCLTPKALKNLRNVTKQSFVYDAGELPDGTYLVSYSGNSDCSKNRQFRKRIKYVNLTQEYQLKFNVYMNG